MYPMFVFFPYDFKQRKPTNYETTYSLDIVEEGQQERASVLFLQGFSLRTQYYTNVEKTENWNSDGLFIISVLLFC